MKLTGFQKFMLALLAGMLAFFSILMAVFRTHPGVEFEESLLRITEGDGETAYSGRAHGTPVTITAVRDPDEALTTVTFSIPGVAEDVCLVEYPLDPIQTERGGTVPGIRVSKNGQLLFQGGYDPDHDYGWFDQSGAWSLQIPIRFYSSGGDPWYGYETQVTDIAAFAFGPALSARGEPMVFAMAVILTLLLAVDVLFHKELFRWRHWGARDPEPTEGYLEFERMVWAAVSVVLAVLYITAMIRIY